MRAASFISSLFLGFLLFSPQLPAAEVFKCTGADGKTSYSATPCVAEGAKQVRVPIVAGPARVTSAQGKDWAAENAAANARAAAAMPQNAASAPSANAPKASTPSKSTRQIVAECEANRGTNCSGEDEVARRRSDERALTPEEAAAQQSAVAGRRQREKAQVDANAKAQAKSQAPSGSNTTPVPVKTGR